MIWKGRWKTVCSRKVMNPPSITHKSCSDWIPCAKPSSARGNNNTKNFFIIWSTASLLSCFYSACFLTRSLVLTNVLWNEGSHEIQSLAVHLPTWIHDNPWHASKCTATTHDDIGDDMQHLNVILLMLPKVKLVHGTPDDYWLPGD
jgi:hypothetical protein